MLEIENLTRRFAGPGGRTVLDGLSLAVEAGSIVAIVGESGAGKSTLLNLIAALDVPDGGRIALDGVAVSALDEAARTAWRRDHLGFIFQAFHVLPHLSLRQNVALPLWLQGGDDATHAAAADRMLARVGLAGREDSRPAELSGGELQRVAIARALVHRPRLVLADEPTGNLDPSRAGQILALLRAQVVEAGAIGLLVTHSLEAARTADRILRLADGRLAAAP
ncbi:MAG: ABC transporter ATP-binding protein [Rhodocyclaceae bacterium]|nr:ABC transporter ATP-binding protein [Rhodocyclaceae bacterium]